MPDPGLTLPPLTLSGDAITEALSLAYLGLGELVDGKWGVCLHGKLTTVSLLGLEMTRLEMEPSGTQTFPVPLGAGAHWARLIQYDDHKGRADIPVEGGVLKPYMLSTMLNAIAGSYASALPQDAFLYQDPVTKTSIAWWVSFNSSGYASAHWLPGGVFYLSGLRAAAAPQEKFLGLNPASVLGGTEIRYYDKTGDWPSGTELEPWLVKGGKVLNANGGEVELVWRLLDHTPNGKKALFALSESSQQWEMCYTLAEFTASGSLADDSFNITARIAMNAEATLGPCEVLRSYASANDTTTYLFHAEPVHSAFYDAWGEIVPVRFIQDVTHAQRYNDWTNAGNPNQTPFQVELHTVSEYKWQAGTASQTFTCEAKLRLDQGNDTINPYTATAFYSGNGVVINETESLDTSEYFLHHYHGLIQSYMYLAIMEVFLKNGNRSAQCIGIGYPTGRKGLSYLTPRRISKLEVNYTEHWVSAEWDDSPTMYGRLGNGSQYIFTPRCYGFIYRDYAPDDAETCKIGAVYTPSVTLPAESSAGSWETRKRYIAWHPVSGAVIQDSKPCGWI
jgi:hypothetical protein